MITVEKKIAYALEQANQVLRRAFDYEPDFHGSITLHFNDGNYKHSVVTIKNRSFIKQ